MKKEEEGVEEQVDVEESQHDVFRLFFTAHAHTKRYCCWLELLPPP